MRTRVVKRKLTGEVLEVRQDDEGVYICPICGYPVSDLAPYEDTYGLDDNREPVGPPFATPSYEKCECCQVYFGEQDYPKDGESYAQTWHRLRLAWLARQGWSDDALRQLRENLGIDTDQLKRQAGRE